MADGGVTSGDESAAMESLLQQKDEGVSILVSGDVPNQFHYHLSRCLLGAAGEGRRRLLGLTRPTPAMVTERTSHRIETDPSRFRVVLGGNWKTANRYRSRATLNTTSAPAGFPPTIGGPNATFLRDPTVGAFTEQLKTGMTELKPVDGTWEPAQLRVTVDSFRDLIAAESVERATEAVRELAAETVARQGMFHVHARAGWRDDEVEQLRAATDMTMRIQPRDGRLMFRPYLDGESATDWQALPSIPE